MGRFEYAVRWAASRIIKLSASKHCAREPQEEPFSKENGFLTFSTPKPDTMQAGFEVCLVETLSNNIDQDEHEEQLAVSHNLVDGYYVTKINVPCLQNQA